MINSRHTWRASGAAWRPGTLARAVLENSGDGRHTAPLSTAAEIMGTAEGAISSSHIWLRSSSSSTRRALEKQIPLVQLQPQEPASVSAVQEPQLFLRGDSNTDDVTHLLREIQGWTRLKYCCPL